MNATTAAADIVAATDYALDALTPSSIILIFVMGVISVVTVAGNLIVLLSYYLDKNIRQPSNYFIFSLAISDLIIGLEGIPVYTYFFAKDQHWPFGAFLCDLWLSLDYSCCLASIYTVLGITIDRYCSVKYPAAYRNWRTQTKVLLIIAVTWIVPSVLFTISIFGYSLFSGRGRILKEDECYVQFMTNAYLNMGMYIAYYWSTLFLMLYLYYGIYSAAKQLATKSDQKQKRLALLSEMRKTNNRKDSPSVAAASEAAGSNSVGESIPDTSDSAFSRLFNQTVSTSQQQPAAVGKPPSFPKKGFHSKKENHLAKGNGRIAAAAGQQRRSPERRPQPSPEGAINRSFDRTPDNSDKSKSSDERPTITEQTTNFEKSDISMGFETSVTISVQPIEPIGDFVPNGDPVGSLEPPDDDLSFAFSIDDEIPFIDEDSLTSLSRSIRVNRMAIPLKSFFKEKSGPIQPVAPPANTPAFTEPPLIAEQMASPTPPPPPPKASTPPPPAKTLSPGRPLCQKFSLDTQTAARRIAADRPTLSTISTPPYASLSVVVEKSSTSNGPISVRRLLTVMRHQTNVRRHSKAQRPQPKTAHSRSENRARKALRTITVILGSFTVLWTPFYVLATVYGFCERCKNSYEFNLLYTISYYLCYMNSPLNPICYAFANQQFKRAFKRILRGDFRRM